MAQVPEDDRLARLEQVIARQQEQIARLEAALAHTAAPPTVPSPAAARLVESSRGDRQRPRTARGRARSRRALLQLGGAAAAAGVAAAVVGNGPAQARSATATVVYTAVGPGNVAIEGDGTDYAAGVLGTSDLGVGVAGTTGNGSGVSGTAKSVGGYGVFGLNDAGTGVAGQSADVTGVLGKSSNGVALLGFSVNGYGAMLDGGLAPLRLNNNGQAGAPTMGTHQVGELYVDSGGILWYCAGAGTPGTWMRLTGVPNGTPGGALNFLPHPIRIFDSRVASGAPLPLTKARVPANTVETMPVTGTIVGGLSVPAGATAVIANATAVNPSGPGFLSYWPHGAPFPGTSNLNYVGGQIVPNFVIVGLDATGQIDYEAGGGSDTDMIFDVAGYVM